MSVSPKDLIEKYQIFVNITRTEWVDAPKISYVNWSIMNDLFISVMLLAVDQIYHIKRSFSVGVAFTP